MQGGCCVILAGWWNERDFLRMKDFDLACFDGVGELRKRVGGRWRLFECEADREGGILGR